MSEHIEKNNNSENEKIAEKISNNHIFQKVWKFIAQTFLLSEDQESEYKTIDTIKRSIEFKGTNLWIFICAIFIASIGLNVNSTAVIIGAMLISPLMGPIMGVGLSVGINDYTFFKRSLKNLGIMTVVGILTSAIYFYLTPINGAQSEILARTYPTIYDVLIATFGGFAGIIAGSRIEKGNAIPGVAIATALMPPLATVGYGLATLNWEFFAGALYLYLINCQFIGISTLVFTRWLKFPQKEYMDAAKEKRNSRIVWALTFLVALPSVYLAYNLIIKNNFETHAQTFVTEEVENKGFSVIRKSYLFGSDTSTIELTLFGNSLDEYGLRALNEKLRYYKLNKTRLVIHQGEKQEEIDYNKLNSDLRANVLEDLYDRNTKIMEDKDEKIKLLENEILTLQKEAYPTDKIYRELETFEPDVSSISLGRVFTAKNDSKMDTVTTCILTTKENKPLSSKQLEKINKWLLTRLEKDTITLVQRN